MYTPNPRDTVNQLQERSSNLNCKLKTRKESLHIYIHEYWKQKSWGTHELQSCYCIVQNRLAKYQSIEIHICSKLLETHPTLHERDSCMTIERCTRAKNKPPYPVLLKASDHHTHLHVCTHTGFQGVLHSILSFMIVKRLLKLPP